MSDYRGEELPFINELRFVPRPAEADPDTMWDQLVDLCEHDDDLEALFDMMDQAEGR